MENFETPQRQYQRGMFGYTGGTLGELSVFPLYEIASEDDLIMGDLNNRVSRTYTGGFDTENPDFSFFRYGELDFEGNPGFSDFEPIPLRVMDIFVEMVEVLINQVDILPLLKVEDLDNDPAHRTHCCEIHGCKYGYVETCPVYRQVEVQAYLCEECDESENLDAYIKSREAEIALIESTLVPLRIKNKEAMDLKAKMDAHNAQ